MHYQFNQRDKNSPLYYSIGSRLRVPYLIKAISDLPKGAVCLDLGCGIGFFSGILVNLGYKVIGLDPDQTAIQKASQLCQSDNLKFQVAYAENLPLEDNSVDFILCSEVLEHVKDIKKVFEEIKRVAKKRAKFFITVPSREGIFSTFFLKIGHHEENTYEKDYHQPFTRAEIIQILVENDFSINKFYYSKIFFSEIFMGLTKKAHEYLTKGKVFSGQSDISSPPKIYKIIFPLILIVGRMEDLLLKFFKGHMIIIEGEINPALKSK